MPVSVDIRLVYRLCTRLTVTVSSITKSYSRHSCLELDIWDGGKDGKGALIPVVWHGHTMTSKISFMDILQTIKVFLNFHPDSFPIILSFENHCSIPYQQVMAETLERVLGDSLYVPTEVSLYGKLPSPSQLRGQVVIKGRRPDGTEADAYDTDDDSEDGRGATSSMGFSTIEEQEAREKVQQYGVAPELAKLTLFHGHKFNSWEESLRSPTHHMHSFSENKVRSRCRHKEAFQWIIYNQTHMSRTYPAGSRVDSSNYNPLLGWSTGECRFVAFRCRCKAFQVSKCFAMHEQDVKWLPSTSKPKIISSD
jgi:phosphatidylinositol phospholipase C, delta